MCEQLVDLSMSSRYNVSTSETCLAERGWMGTRWRDVVVKRHHVIYLRPSYFNLSTADHTQKLTGSFYKGNPANF